MSDKKNPSRRDFLKGSTAAAAGLTLAGGLNIARSAHAAESGELKACLIGCGGRGNGAASDFMKGGQMTETPTKIVAVADAFEDKAKGAAGRFKVPPEKTFWGFDAYRKAIDSGCDVCVIATSPGFRPIHHRAAIEAGKHVFMEKPCCTDAPGFNMLMETNKLADEKGLKVVVGLQRRHQGSYIQGIKEIQDGKYGDIIFTRVYWNGGGVWVRGRKPEQTEMEYQMRNWYYFVWLCGDNICEQHVHNLDIGNWVMGDHPVEANAMGGREVRKGKDHGEIFDHHFVEYTYADGRKMYSQCRHIRGCWNSVSEAAHGTKGAGGVSSRGGKGAGPYQQEHADLITAIKKNEKCNDGWYGATSSFTAVLGRMASYSGQVVRWDDLAKKGKPLMIYEDHDKLTMNSKPPVVPDANGNYPVAVPGQYKPY